MTRANSDIVIYEEDFALLNEEERTELERWLSQDKPPLAVSTAAKMFEVFLQWKTTEEIHKLNPQFEWGAIIHARLRDRWDKRRSEFTNQAYDTIRHKVVKAQMDAIEMASNLLTVTAKKNNDKFLRFLQTGDAKELQDTMELKNLKQFKDAVETLQKLTGQDKKPETNPVTNIRAEQVQVVNVNDQKQLPSMESSTASDLIKKALEAKEEV